jgi:hypothetical protein
MNFLIFGEFLRWPGCPGGQLTPETPTRTTPYLHVGRKLYLRNPRDPSPHLLGLACLVPASHLWCSSTLLFDLLGYHCCRNKPTDALVSQTLLYYCRVIRKKVNILSSTTYFSQSLTQHHEAANERQNAYSVTKRRLPSE